jgi:putative molybdopterin biosynthesis protein
MAATDTKTRPADTAAADELLTVEQVQELLKVGRTFAYALVRSGQLPSYRVGRLLRIRRRDVEHWLESRR